MTKKYKILGKYIKDLSSETPDVETYLYVRDNISKYQLDINITSKALKNKLIEINTTFKFLDKENNKKKTKKSLNLMLNLALNLALNLTLNLNLI